MADAQRDDLFDVNFVSIDAPHHLPMHFIPPNHHSASALQLDLSRDVSLMVNVAMGTVWKLNLVWLS